MSGAWRPSIMGPKESLTSGAHLHAQMTNDNNTMKPPPPRNIRLPHLSGPRGGRWHLLQCLGVTPMLLHRPRCVPLLPVRSLRGLMRRGGVPLTALNPEVLLLACLDRGGTHAEAIAIREGEHLFPHLPVLVDVRKHDFCGVGSMSSRRSPPPETQPHPCIENSAVRARSRAALAPSASQAPLFGQGPSLTPEQPATCTTGTL